MTTFKSSSDIQGIQREKRGRSLSLPFNKTFSIRDVFGRDSEEPIEAADAKSLTPGVTGARRKRPTGTRTGPSTTRAPVGGRCTSSGGSKNSGPSPVVARATRDVGLFNRGPIVFQPQLFSLGQKRTALNSFLWKRNRERSWCAREYIQ